jgi:hypothetical protein
MNMKGQTSKLVLAGVFATCVFGGLAVGTAWATLGAGISTTIVSGPARLNPIEVRSESDVNEVEIKTNGISDLYTVYNKVVPGGHTGWHSHPGPSIITVKSGTATEYHADEPGVAHVHEAGSTFVDDGKGAHIVRNEGTVDLELVAVQILPAGAPRRIDMPAP